MEAVTDKSIRYIVNLELALIALMRDRQEPHSNMHLSNAETRAKFEGQKSDTQRPNAGSLTFVSTATST
jgi:hypothetical protein